MSKIKPLGFGKGQFGGRRAGFGRAAGQNGQAAQRPATGHGSTPTSETSPQAQANGDDPLVATRISPETIQSVESEKANGAANTGQIIERIADKASEMLSKHFQSDELRMSSKEEVLTKLNSLLDEMSATENTELRQTDRQELITFLLIELEENIGKIGDSTDTTAPKKGNGQQTLLTAKEKIHPLLLEHIDPAAAASLDRAELTEQVGDVVGELLVQEKFNLNLREQGELVSLILDDMLGLGPLEPLLADEAVSDIMVNGPQQVYVERKGKVVLTDVTFRDNHHLMNIAQRIVTAVGRRVDESSPICDARLPDGSRVNVIAPPLAIDGASISIRKFSADKITLDKMLNFGSLSPPLAKLLKIAGACRLNILISGGTGSGKTTMLNAMSRMVDKGERVVTIEDAAELQLQQPHVVRLETRPPNLEGKGEITMRDLVKNALRMRPDRIILGEIRGGEAIDMLQAMNTGHDGSMGTIHANRPREALTRLENMVNMAGLNLPTRAIREQIAASLDMIVQVQRLRDGSRKTIYVTEVVGMEGEVITTQDLFRYEYTGEDASGRLVGDFKSSEVRPHFLQKAEYFGLGRALMEAMNG